MAIGFGHNSELYINDGSAERNWTPYLDGFDATFGATILDATTYGQGGVVRRAGLEDNSFTISGKYETNGTASPGKWFANMKANQYASGTSGYAFKYFPDGSASGHEYWSGNCLGGQFSISAPVDNVETFTGSFPCSGTVAQGTV